MKDTCKQAIFRKDTRSRSRVEDPLRAGDQEERELEFFNNGEPTWSNDPDERLAFDPNFDEFADYT